MEVTNREFNVWRAVAQCIRSSSTEKEKRAVSEIFKICIEDLEACLEEADLAAALEEIFSEKSEIVALRVSQLSRILSEQRVIH